MISSDPDLAKAHTLVRIDEPKDGEECLVSSTEREAGTPAQSPNYLSVEPGQVANAWLNELVAPLQGVESAREAHGNRAAAELALEVCTEFGRDRPSLAGSAPAAHICRRRPPSPRTGERLRRSRIQGRHGETRQALFRPSRDVQVRRPRGCDSPASARLGAFRGDAGRT